MPGAGPTVSRKGVLAALERGRLEPALLGGVPSGPALIELGGTERKRMEILVTVPAEGSHANDRRYRVCISGGGYRGLLLSESTRIPGLVSVVDIAPTALGAEGELSSRPQRDVAGYLRELDGWIDVKNRARLPASLVVAVLVAAFALSAPRLVPPALASALLANLLLGLAGGGSAWLLVVVIGLAVAGGGPLLGSFLRTPLAVGLLLAGVVAAYAVAMALDGTIVALSPLGPSQSGRFYGISNLLATLLLVPALVGAALLRRRLGWTAFAAVAAGAVATVGGSRLGADGGGALVLLTGFLVLAVRSRGSALTVRRLALASAGVAALALVLVGLDAAVGASSHVTDSLASGPLGLARDMADRLELSGRRVVSSWGSALVVVAGLAVLARIALRRPRLPLTDALLVAVAVSLLVNDTPSDVAGFGALVAGATRRWEDILRGRAV